MQSAICGVILSSSMVCLEKRPSLLRPTFQVHEGFEMATTRKVLTKAPENVIKVLKKICSLIIFVRLIRPDDPKSVRILLIQFFLALSSGRGNPNVFIVLFTASTNDPFEGTRERRSFDVKSDLKRPGFRFTFSTFSNKINIMQCNNN
ncbi:Protein of unknown function, partial [Gryllus bimaculatus]